MLPWSCDTFVAMTDSVPGGHVLLAKNSDRPVSDTQPLRFLPRRTAQAGATVRLAHLEIDDVEESYAHLGGSPYWCWGHEEGLNEWGVAIGNEALFTRDWAATVSAVKGGADRDGGILGMELLRLGLERGRTAREALDVICSLVERYGQWGSGVVGQPPVTGGYDNSFLIADAQEAWVLETSGHRWVAKQVTTGTYAISNQPTIRTQWDRASGDLVEHAVDSGWWESAPGRSFDFARAYVDTGTPLQLSHIRLQRSRQLLGEAVGAGGVGLGQAKRVLRDHYEDTFLGGPYFNAAVPDFLSLCMHSHPSDFTWGNTAGSAVFVLPKSGEGLAHLWWTPVTPCTGVYVPVFVDAGRVPGIFSAAGTAGVRECPAEHAPVDTYDEGSYWWRFRRLLDLVKGGEQAWSFNENQPVVRRAFDALERQWAAELPQVEKDALVLREQSDHAAMADFLADYTESCTRQALEVLDHLVTQLSG